MSSLPILIQNAHSLFCPVKTWLLQYPIEFGKWCWKNIKIIYIYIYALNQTKSGYFNLQLPMNVIKYGKPAKISLLRLVQINNLSIHIIPIRDVKTRGWWQKVALACWGMQMVLWLYLTFSWKLVLAIWIFCFCLSLLSCTEGNCSIKLVE